MIGNKINMRADISILRVEKFVCRFFINPYKKQSTDFWKIVGILGYCRIFPYKWEQPVQFSNIHKKLRPSENPYNLATLHMEEFPFYDKHVVRYEHGSVTLGNYDSLTNWHTDRRTLGVIRKSQFQNDCWIIYRFLNCYSYRYCKHVFIKVHYSEEYLF